MNSFVSSGHGGAVTADFAKFVQQPTACRIVRVHLLGPMRATSYLGGDILPRGKKARAMLAYLCLTFGAKVPRIRLARLLWDQVSDELARGSLRHALQDVYSAMGPLAEELISTNRAAIQLKADACWIDAVALLESFSRDSMRSDLALFCSGRLLEGLDCVSASFDRWLARERDRFNWKMRGLRRLQSAQTRSYDKLDLSLRSPSHTETDAPHSLPVRNRFRVAVLPFEGRGDKKGQDLAFSLSHNIAAALARFRWFDVVAPFSFSEDLLQRKDMDYALEGLVSRHGRLIDVNVRLLDLTRRTQPVWSERFELPLFELHRLNEMVTKRVVGCIDPVILSIESRPNRREDYGATGLLLLAIPLLFSAERRKFDRAGVLIHRAMEIDPKNAIAPAWAAFWHCFRVGQGWARDLVASLATAEAFCLKAIEIDPDNAEALGIYAHTCAWKRNFDAAIRYFDRSLRLNPNLAFIWALSGSTYCWIGEPAAALLRLNRYRDLAPSDPYFCIFEATYAVVYFFNGDYEQAVLVGRRAVKANPDFSAGYKPLIASLGLLKRADEAAPFIAKLRSLEPQFTIEHHARTYPFKRAEDLRRYMRGLLLAGVPKR